MIPARVDLAATIGSTAATSFGKSAVVISAVVIPTEASHPRGLPSKQTGLRSRW